MTTPCQCANTNQESFAVPRRVKIAVTGAAGQIGYALLFRIASGQMFGPFTKVDLNLLELPQALSALEGVVMELRDCAFPYLGEILCTDDPQEAFKDVDWALLVGSVPRKAGMERADLLKINAKVFIEQGKALANNAKSSTKVLVIGNPCNTNAYIAKEMAKETIEEKNFFALTMLDQNRAVALLAEKAGASVSEVKNLAIWGNHSATQYPDFYHAAINGQNALEAIPDEQWLQTEFLTRVQKRGAEIIQKRGVSSAASAANAVIDTVRKLTLPTEEGDFFSVAVCSDGSYGIQKGLIFSFPVAFDGKNWKIIQKIDHRDGFAKDKLAQTYQELLTEKKQVEEFIKELH